MSDPLGTLSELREQLDSGADTSAALVERSFARLEAVDPTLRAFLFIRREAALREAAEADRRRARGEARGPLDGIPIAIKDNIVQSGEPASCASRILEGYVSPFDATAVAKLRDAGAVIVGRTNLDEFAMGSSTEHSSILPGARPSRCRPAWCRSRWGVTPAARSGSRRRSVGWWA
jgi:aspartyl-tRNA(Asn)/glutamyl-tRNA(Gln) amidotransferase subunit A